MLRFPVFHAGFKSAKPVVNLTPHPPHLLAWLMFFDQGTVQINDTIEVHAPPHSNPTPFSRSSSLWPQGTVQVNDAIELPALKLQRQVGPLGTGGTLTCPAT